MFPQPVVKICLCLHLLPQPSIPLQKRKCLCSSGQLLLEARDLVPFLLKGFPPAVITPTPLHWNHQFIPLYRIGLQASENYSSLKTKLISWAHILCQLLFWCSLLNSKTPQKVNVFLLSPLSYFLFFLQPISTRQFFVVVCWFVFQKSIKGEGVDQKKKTKNSFNAIRNVLFKWCSTRLLHKLDYVVIFFSKSFKSVNS